MTKDRYLKMKQWFADHSAAYKILKFLYRFLPLIMFIAVPVLTVIKAFMGFDADFIKMICVPLGVLGIVTVTRNIINRPRPYEKYCTAPIINRDGKGKSFPSRHTSSAFIIAMCAISVSVPVAISLLAVSLLIGLTRILSGVHYICDVLAGMVFSLAVGFVFFVII